MASDANAFTAQITDSRSGSELAKGLDSGLDSGSNSGVMSGASNGDYRCGWVAILGPANAGKSTLLNAILGQKISIVTPKAQTTRNQIVGILTEEEAQIIFMDTPGVSQMRGGHLSRNMLQSIWQSLAQADCVAIMLDAHLYIRKPELLENDLAPLADALNAESRQIIFIVNKIDLFADKSRLLPLLTKLNSLWSNADIVPISATNGDGVPELIATLKKALPVGVRLFPEDQISTAPVRFMVAELIREQLFLHLRQEVPYGVAVEIESWREDEQHTVINALIYVASPQHKGMVIGKRGAMLKEIGSQARKHIQNLLQTKVHLELWVKVRRHWMEDAAFIRQILDVNGLSEFCE